jgi:hypothetical protein
MRQHHLPALTQRHDNRPQHRDPAASDEIQRSARRPAWDLHAAGTSANRNGAVGIVTVSGTVDGGGNRAAGNRHALQWLSIVSL